MLQAGANFYLKNSSGKTALDLAIEANCSNQSAADKSLASIKKAKTIKAIKDYQQFFEYMESLKSLPISIYLYDAEQLIAAIETGDIKLANEALANKADVNARIKGGSSVLHLAG